MKTAVLLASTLYFLATHALRDKIDTTRGFTKRSLVTTGDIIEGKIQFENMHLKYAAEDPKPVSDEEKASYLGYVQMRDKFVLDYANEDPMNFRPDIKDYYVIASKRGFLLNFAATLMLILGLWVFALRIGYGDCGGYKTMVRKPTKSDRYVVQVVGIIGLSLFFYGAIYTSYFLVKDRSSDQTVYKSLQFLNADQIKKIDNAIATIKSINKHYLRVFYSTVSIELFKIGNFLDPIRPEYARSLEKAQIFAEEFFKKPKTSLTTKFLFMAAAVVCCITAFGYAYKNRRVLVSLGLAFVLIMSMYINVNAIADAFNIWSVSLDLCKQTLYAFDHDKGLIKDRYNDGFSEILTCLSYDNKKRVSSQLNSLDIAKNTVHQLMMVYFDQTPYAVDMQKNFNSALGAHQSYKDVEHVIKGLVNETQEVKNQLMSYLKLTETLNEEYKNLMYLKRCEALTEWISQVNNHVCQKGVSYQYNLMWGLAMIFLSTVLIAACLFLSENIIRGLYNEEIQYVKTNRLRHDWN